MAEPVITGSGEVGSLLTATTGTDYPVVRRMWRMDDEDLCTINESDQLMLILPHIHGVMQVAEYDDSGAVHLSNEITCTQPGSTPLDQIIDINDRFDKSFNEDWSDGNVARINRDGITPIGSTLAFSAVNRWGNDYYPDGEQNRYTFAGDPGHHTNQFASPSTYHPFAINTDKRYCELSQRKVTAAEAPHVGGAKYLSSMIRSMYSQKEGWFEVDIWLSSDFEGWLAVWMQSMLEAWPPETDLIEARPKGRPTEGHINRHMPPSLLQRLMGMRSVQDFSNGTGWHSLPDGRPLRGNLHTFAHRQTPEGISEVYYDGRKVNNFSVAKKIIERMYGQVSWAVPPDDTDWLDPYDANTPASGMAMRCYGMRWWYRASEAARGPAVTQPPVINQGRNGVAGDVFTSTDATWTGRDTSVPIKKFWQVDGLSDENATGDSFQTKNPDHVKVSLFKSEIATDLNGYETKTSSPFTWVVAGSTDNTDGDGGNTGGDDGSTGGNGENAQSQGPTGQVLAVARAGMDVAQWYADAQNDPAGSQRDGYSGDGLSDLGVNAIVELSKNGTAYYRTTVTTGAPIVLAEGAIVFPAQFTEPPSINIATDVSNGEIVFSVYNASDATKGFDVACGPVGSENKLIVVNTDGVKPLRTASACLIPPTDLDSNIPTGGGVTQQSTTASIAQRTVEMNSKQNDQDMPGVPSYGWSKLKSEMGANEVHAQIAMGAVPRWQYFENWIRSRLLVLGFNQNKVWTAKKPWIVLTDGSDSAHTAVNVGIRYWQYETWGRRRTDKVWVRIDKQFLGGHGGDNSAPHRATKDGIYDTSETLIVRKPAGQDYREMYTGGAEKFTSELIHPYGYSFTVADGVYDQIACGLPMQLILWDASGTDDLANANLMSLNGGDWYPSLTETFGNNWSPGLGTSAATNITTDKQWFTWTMLTTMGGAAKHNAQTVAEWLANPAPFGS